MEELPDPEKELFNSFESNQLSANSFTKVPFGCRLQHPEKSQKKNIFAFVALAILREFFLTKTVKSYQKSFCLH